LVIGTAAHPVEADETRVVVAVELLKVLQKALEVFLRKLVVMGEHMAVVDEHQPRHIVTTALELL